MTPRRTEFAAFVLDLLDFVEKIGEAMENEPSRVAAIGEAAGAIPVVRDRLRENDLANTQCILALGNMIEQRWPSEWWRTSPRWTRRNSKDHRGPRRAAGAVCYPACHRGGGRVVARQTEACPFAAQQSGTTSAGSN
jgi:hypothetical protein